MGYHSNYTLFTPSNECIMEPHNYYNKIIMTDSISPQAVANIRQSMSAICAVLFALVLLFVSSQSAHAALLNQVNSAVRTAGASLTTERSSAFQKGVTNGHYTSYAQLVGAIKWHLAKGTLPSFTAVTVKKASTGASSVKVTVKTCITGQVISMSEYRVTIKGNLDDGSTLTKAMNITLGQYNNAIDQGVVHGLNVKACTTNNFHSLSGDIENRS